MSAGRPSRVAMFAILLAVALALAAVCFRRIGRTRTPEERARQAAEELRERARRLMQ